MLGEVTTERQARSLTDLCPKCGRQLMADCYRHVPEEVQFPDQFPWNPDRAYCPGGCQLTVSAFPSDWKPTVQ